MRRGQITITEIIIALLIIGIIVGYIMVRYIVKPGGSMFSMFG